MFKYKQAILLRKDLKMSPGKAIAQGAHVSVKAAVATHGARYDVYYDWVSEGHAKIVLRVDSETELLRVFKKATDGHVIAEVVRDFGLTQLEANTLTALAVGPDLVEKIDLITGGLKLY